MDLHTYMYFVPPSVYFHFVPVGRKGLLAGQR